MRACIGSLDILSQEALKLSEAPKKQRPSNAWSWTRAIASLRKASSRQQPQHFSLKPALQRAGAKRPQLKNNLRAQKGDPPSRHGHSLQKHRSTTSIGIFQGRVWADTAQLRVKGLGRVPDFEVLRAAVAPTYCRDSSRESPRRRLFRLGSALSCEALGVLV